MKNLFVAPATIDLAGVEIELVPAFSRELKLKRAIDTVIDDFDFVLIDCPPSLGPDHGQRAGRRRRGPGPHPVRVLRPRGSEPAAAQRPPGGVQPQSATLEVSTIVLTMYDARTRLADRRGQRGA